jgi:hypothetical protein
VQLLTGQCCKQLNQFRAKASKGAKNAMMAASLEATPNHAKEKKG